MQQVTLESVLNATHKLSLSADLVSNMGEQVDRGNDRPKSPSNVRNGVLATSVTTRYKKKVSTPSPVSVLEEIPVHCLA